MIGSNTQTNGGKERSWRENSDALSDISTTLNSTLADMVDVVLSGTPAGLSNWNSRARGSDGRCGLLGSFEGGRWRGTAEPR